MLERGGNAKVRVVRELSKAEVLPILKAQIAQNAFVMTDEAKYFHNLNKDGFVHYTNNHDSGEYVRWVGSQMISTNGIENFWGQLKRSLHGTYHKVSRKHLQKYVDEFSFRYNRRKALKPMFSLVLRQLSRPS